MLPLQLDYSGYVQYEGLQILQYRRLHGCICCNAALLLLLSPLSLLLLLKAVGLAPRLLAESKQVPLSLLLSSRLASAAAAAAVADHGWRLTWASGLCHQWFSLSRTTSGMNCKYGCGVRAKYASNAHKLLVEPEQIAPVCYHALGEGNRSTPAEQCSDDKPADMHPSGYRLSALALAAHDYFHALDSDFA